MWNDIAPDQQILKMGIKTFLRGEQIQLLYRKVYRKTTIIGRKLNVSNSNKMQPLLNASKVWQTIPAGSLKKARAI